MAKKSASQNHSKDDFEPKIISASKSGRAPKKLDKTKLALYKIDDLRKEVIESQKIRAQVIGFKITFVATATGFIVSGLSKIVESNHDQEGALDYSGALLLVPAFAAIFFDLLISGYSFSIKRLGFYMKEYLEPIIRSNSDWPKDVPLWEEYLSRKGSKQNLSKYGNFGMTVLTCVLAVMSLFFIGKLHVLASITFAVVLTVALELDRKATFPPYKFTKE